MGYMTPIHAVPVAPASPPAAALRDTDERAMMVRLFGGGPAPAEDHPVAAISHPADDDFAPNLGRYVDVVA